MSGSLFFTAGSPSLAHLIRRTAKDIPHPTDPKRTLWDAGTDVGPYSGPVDAEFLAVHEAGMKRRSSPTGVYTLGSGSDFTVFLQRLGVCLPYQVCCNELIRCNRLRASINLSVEHSPMQYIIITASTTVYIG